MTADRNGPDPAPSRRPGRRSRAHQGSPLGVGPALEWLARRADGETVTSIARRAGVSPDAVRAATDAYGPFTETWDAPHILAVNDGPLAERNAGWVAARRAGRSTAAIAREFGVSAARVRAVVSPHGPFPPEPDAATIAAWAAHRRSGKTLAWVAAQYRVPARVVRRLTRPHGPFSPPGPRLPDGLLGMKGIARRTGTGEPSIVRWATENRLPEPDFVTATGRRLWLTTTIERWLDTAALATCPECGTRCVGLAQHVGQVHRETP